MQINSLFNDINDVTIEEILYRYGVENPKQYLKAQTIEDSSKYENIEKAKELIMKYVKGGDANVNQE